MDRYFDRYIGALPYENTHIARSITTYVGLLPAHTSVYLVGSTWSPGGMPEPKSIRYAMRDPTYFFEEPAERLDCNRLRQLRRPAVLIWRYQSELPSPSVSDCGRYIPAQIFSSDKNLPMFYAAPVLSEPVAGEMVPPRVEPTIPPGSPNRSEPTSPADYSWQTARVSLNGQEVEMLYLPIDQGQPDDALDGDGATLMRGARDNPYILELHFPQPTPVVSFSLDLGFMQEYSVEVSVRDRDGKVVTVSMRERPNPGTFPRAELILPAGPLSIKVARIAITDFRERPREGWHVHVYELRIR